MSPASSPGSGRDQRAALARDLGDLLIEISIGVHRYAMYPPDHPALASVAENVISRLANYFQDRRSLDIGVAQKQLVIGGVATDSNHPVLSDLARRLHDHQLGAVSFRKGVRAAEVEGFLWALSADTDEGASSLGTLHQDDRPSWEHISVYPVGYGMLEMKDASESPEDERGDRAVELWLGLAQAAVSSDEPLERGEFPSEKDVAESIARHRHEKAYDQVIVGYFLQLGEELKQNSSGEAKRVASRVSGLIRELDDSTLQRLVTMGGDFNRRKQFILDANHTLAVDAVVKVLTAAAATSGQTISNSMVRLLTKLSTHAAEGPGKRRSQADTALRENVERLLDQWELEDPNPDDYTQILDGMARASPLAESAEAPVPDTGEFEEDGALRLVQMGLEVGGWGPTVRSAVSDLVDSGRVGQLFTLIGELPDSRAGTEIRRYVTDPEQVRRFLAGDDVDEESLKIVVEEMGPASVKPLMDALVESESRAVRRKVFDRLVAMEGDLGAEIRRRLQDTRWFVVRNMLALIQRLERPPDDIDFTAFVSHPDPRVRREAFPLAVQNPASRARTLAIGLSDADERLVRMSLVELQQELPETLVPTLVKRVVRSDWPGGLRAMGVRALHGSDSSLARRALLDVVAEEKGLFGRRKLAEKSPVVLAALEVLAADWSDHEEAAALLEAARRSSDREVVGAASGGGVARP